MKLWEFFMGLTSRGSCTLALGWEQLDLPQRKALLKWTLWSPGQDPPELLFPGPVSGWPLVRPSRQAPSHCLASLLTSQKAHNTGVVRSFAERVMACWVIQHPGSQNRGLVFAGSVLGTRYEYVQAWPLRVGSQGEGKPQIMGFVWKGPGRQRQVEKRGSPKGSLEHGTCLDS